MKTVLELLGENGENWMKWAMAATPDGQCVSARDPRACRWCLFGAMIHVYGDDARASHGATVHAKVLAAIQRRDPRVNSVHGWNDAPGRSWAEVREVIEEAGV